MHRRRQAAGGLDENVDIKALQKNIGRNEIVSIGNLIVHRALQEAGQEGTHALEEALAQCGRYFPGFKHAVLRDGQDAFQAAFWSWPRCFARLKESGSVIFLDGTASLKAVGRAVCICRVVWDDVLTTDSYDSSVSPVLPNRQRQIWEVTSCGLWPELVCREQPHWWVYPQTACGMVPCLQGAFADGHD